jgi:hypothetical protein
VNSDQIFALALALLFGFVVPVTLAIVIPWSKARARRQSGVGGPDEHTAMELDGLKDRIAELEERLDFTERMVTDAREQLKLQSGRAGSA